MRADVSFCSSRCGKRFLENPGDFLLLVFEKAGMWEHGLWKYFELVKNSKAKNIYNNKVVLNYNVKKNIFIFSIFSIIQDEKKVSIM